MVLFWTPVVLKDNKLRISAVQPSSSGTLPLTSPTRGTKLQASPCSLSASTRGSDYPAFQPGTAGKPRTIFEAFFSVAHKEGEQLVD